MTPPTRLFRWGIIRAVGWADRNLLLQLQNEEGFELVMLGDDATVQDTRGDAVAPGDLPLGSEVEYAGRTSSGLVLARLLRLCPRSVAGDV
jgi:hypothetical protein